MEYMECLNEVDVKHEMNECQHGCVYNLYQNALMNNERCILLGKFSDMQLICFPVVTTT